MRDRLENAGYSLEEAFFHKLNEELIQKLKEGAKTQPAYENKDHKNDQIEEEVPKKAS